MIVFRGTESVGDWLTDLNIFSVVKAYGIVHKGFYNTFSSVKPLLEQKLKQRAPVGRILLAGHSLGDALATIAAAEWKGAYPIHGIYTFGQPAVGQGDLFLNFFRDYNDKFFRLVNDNDIITRVPPTYQHIGRLFHFDAHGGLESRKEAISDKVHDVGSTMMSKAEFDYFRAQLLAQRARQDGVITESLAGPVLEGLLPSVNDHRLSEYIKKVKVQVS